MKLGSDLRSSFEGGVPYFTYFLNKKLIHLLMATSKLMSLPFWSSYMIERDSLTSIGTYSLLSKVYLCKFYSIGNSFVDVMSKYFSRPARLYKSHSEMSISTTVVKGIKASQMLSWCQSFHREWRAMYARYVDFCSCQIFATTQDITLLMLYHRTFCKTRVLNSSELFVDCSAIKWSRCVDGTQKGEEFKRG